MNVTVYKLPFLLYALTSLDTACIEAMLSHVLQLTLYNIQQKIDSENRARKVYPATLRHNSSPSKLDMDDYKVEEDRFTGPMVDTQLLNIGN